MLIGPIVVFIVGLVVVVSFFVMCLIMFVLSLALLLPLAFKSVGASMVLRSSVGRSGAYGDASSLGKELLGSIHHTRSQ